MTGSADKDIKFFDFEVREIAADPEVVVVEGEKKKEGLRVLTMVHSKTLKMTDDVLAIKYSPDGRLLAVSLLDSTVKVFYADTLKFFLSLYGHKVCCTFSLILERKAELVTLCTASRSFSRHFI